MLHLQDGPAQGHYISNRDIYFVRAAVDVATGKKRLLDQLANQPKYTERVYVYERDTSIPTGHALVRKSGGGGRGAHCVGSFSAGYFHRPDIDGETVRSIPAWQAWVRANAPAGLIDPTTGHPLGEKMSQEEFEWSVLANPALDVGDIIDAPESGADVRREWHV